MRVRLDKYQAAHSSMQTKSILMIVFGAVGIVVFSFVLLLGALMVAVRDNEPEAVPTYRAGLVVAFMGFFPLVLSIILVWRGIVARSRFAKIRELAAFARIKPLFSRDEMAHALSLNPHDAERLFLDAITEQIVVAGAEDYEPKFLGAPPAPVPATSLEAPAQFARGLPTRISHPDVHAPTTPVAIGAGSLLGGTYRVEAPLGAGGMGELFVASHVRTGRKYAIKTIHPDSRLSPDAIRRFEREALAASALGHPNIVAVHDFNSEGGVFYLVMDLLEGETLESRLGRVGSLPWPEAQKLGLELASALAVAHDGGLLHRDIKPANILLTAAKGSPERAVLLDFGLVKSFGDEAASRITATGAAVGTPMYMSPEQARGEALGVTSDIYALGAVIYEMVTGAPPFLDRTLASVYARLLTEPVPAASKVATRRLPPALDAVLDRALAKDAKDRYPGARALAAALAEVPEEAPSTLRIA